MGAIAPTAKKLCGAMPYSRPHRNFVIRRRCTHPEGVVKLRLRHYESEKGALISA